MSRDIDTDLDRSESDRLDDLLDDLEVRTHNDVAAARGLTSVHGKCRVDVRPANKVERMRSRVEVSTVELSRRHLLGLAIEPVAVGSVFHLRFDRAAVDVSPTLALCDRCTMLGDESYELRFRFLQAIDIDPSHLSGQP